jgi:hypothetical protein
MFVIMASLASWLFVCMIQMWIAIVWLGFSRSTRASVSESSIPGYSKDIVSGVWHFWDSDPYLNQYI